MDSSVTLSPSEVDPDIADVVSQMRIDTLSRYWMTLLGAKLGVFRTLL